MFHVQEIQSSIYRRVQGTSGRIDPFRANGAIGRLRVGGFGILVVPLEQASEELQGPFGFGSSRGKRTSQATTSCRGTGAGNLKKIYRLVRENRFVSARAFIEENKAEFPITQMCRVLKVQRSTFYGCRARPKSARAERDRILKERVKRIHEDTHQRYGSPRIHEELHAQGEAVSKKRVARLMKEEGLVGKKRRRFKKTTDSRHNVSPAPDLVQRNFSPAKPNKVWASDLTYIRTLEGWLYLVVFMDLFSRRIVGWAMGENMETELVLKAFRYATDDRKPRAGLVVHSDRGSQYASQAFRDELSKNGFQQSMSRRGNCWDNAVVESFFDSFKTELDLNERVFAKKEVQTKTFRFMEGFYNRVRRHSTLGYLSPDEFENRSAINLAKEVRLSA